MKNSKIRSLRESFIHGLTYLLQKENVDYRRDLQIHSIEVKKKIFRNVVDVFITLERPGLLIGKKGWLIDSLTNVLEKDFDCKVNIILTESNLWASEYIDYNNCS